MRKLFACLGSLSLMTAFAAAGCGSGDDRSKEEDPQFTADYTQDYENDVDEDAAQQSEETTLDTLDDLDDIELDGTTASSPSPMTKGSPPGRPKRAPHGPLSIMEDDPHFSDGNAVANMAEARKLGVNVIRVMIMWRSTLKADVDYKALTKPQFVKTNPDNYDWTKYDTIVDNARASGMKVLITLAAPMPYWASEDPAHCAKQEADDLLKAPADRHFWSCSWKPDVRAYAQWVTAVARHYQGRRIWGWTLWNEPNIGSFLSDDSSYEGGMRYRRMWFSGRKAIRKTAGVTARVFFTDQANGKDLDSNGTSFRTFMYALCLDPHDGDVLPARELEKCPSAPRRVYTSGIAFHPYSSTPTMFVNSIDFMTGLVDEAIAKKRLSGNRNLYLTEHAFLTAKGVDAGTLGGSGAVTLDQQAVYDNIVEHRMYGNARVKTIAQYELFDEGRGIWDCGLEHPDGSPKPAYAAYKVAIDVTKVGANDVEVFGLARLASDTAYSIEAKVGTEWKIVATVTADAVGWGKKTIPIAGATAWRIDYLGDKSRETAAR